MVKTTSNMNREQVFKVLKEIQESVPENLRKNVVSETYIAPQVRMVVEKALESPDFPEEKKAQLRVLIDSGVLDQKNITENQKIARQIDNYVLRKIRQAIKEGRLPSKKQLKELNLLNLHDKS